MGVLTDLPAGLVRSMLAERVDEAATVFSSRRAEERYFVWEQSDRDGFALGGIGSAWTVDAAPARDRFGFAAAQCIEAAHEAVAEPEHGLPACGPVWMGGFAFAPDGGAAP